MYLEQNKTAYNSYFKWKRHIWFHNLRSIFSPICSMCIQLQLEEFIGVKQKVIDDLGKYWNVDQCKTPIIEKKDGIMYYRV